MRNNDTHAATPPEGSSKVERRSYVPPFRGGLLVSALASLTLAGVLANIPIKPLEPSWRAKASVLCYGGGCHVFGGATPQPVYVRAGEIRSVYCGEEVARVSGDVMAPWEGVRAQVVRLELHRRAPLKLWRTDAQPIPPEVLKACSDLAAFVARGRISSLREDEADPAPVRHVFTTHETVDHLVVAGFAFYVLVLAGAALLVVFVLQYGGKRRIKIEYDPGRACLIIEQGSWWGDHALVAIPCARICDVRVLPFGAKCRVRLERNDGGLRVDDIVVSAADASDLVEWIGRHREDQPVSYRR